MGHIRHLWVKVALLVLGLTPILEAQSSTATSGPQFCPPADQFLTPTLVDILIPGFTH